MQGNAINIAISLHARNTPRDEGVKAHRVYQLQSIHVGFFRFIKFIDHLPPFRRKPILERARLHAGFTTRSRPSSGRLGRRNRSSGSRLGTLHRRSATHVLVQIARLLWRSRLVLRERVKRGHADHRNAVHQRGRCGQRYPPEWQMRWLER